MKIIVNISIVLVLCLSNISWAQKKYSSTVRQPDLISQLDSAKALFSKSPMSAIVEVETVIRYAIRQNKPYELALAYSTLAEFNFAHKEYNSALLNSFRAIPTFENQKKYDLLYESLMLTGKSHFQLQQFKSAIKQFNAAVETAEKTRKTSQLLMAKLEVNNCLVSQNKYDEAERGYLQLRQESQGAKAFKLVAEIDFKLGELYEKKGQQIQADDFYNDALSNAYEWQNNSVLTRDNARKVESFNQGKTNDSDTAILNALNKAEAYFQEVKDTSSMTQNSLQKATYYETKGAINEAKTELNQTKELSKKTGDLETQMASSKKLYDIYLSSAAKKEASDELQNYLMLRDSALKMELKKSEEQLALRAVEDQINVLEQERELDQQTILLLEREKQLNTTELKQQRILLIVFGIVVVIFGFFSFLLYRNSKAKKRANQLLYLKSLRAQMNPHFIFNSLNSVNNYIATNNEREANRYLSKFSLLMRKVLDYSQLEFIQLNDEIELLRLYVELEYERFKDKFDYEFKVDSAINTEAYQIPPMIIQPFIENAIWHGLRYKSTKGKLLIVFEQVNDGVEITVKDDGIGRDKSIAIKTPSQKMHQSSGMKNVADRTKMISEVFKTKISHQIVDLPDNTGTKVLIKLFSHG